MTRKPAAPANLRNGLKWRDGRPRWEPSPANRACGFKGMDLKSHDGAWMDRGTATSAADARTIWATTVREAQGDTEDGGKARAKLRAALDRLPPLPADPEARHRRQLVADLIEAGRAVLEHREPDITAALLVRPRTVEALREGFLGDRRAMTALAPKSQAAYTVQSKKLVARFAGRRVETITRPELRDWYLDLCDELSTSSANQVLGVAGAMFRWAMWQSPAWINANPATDLGLKKAAGRRVFWEFEEERAFIAFCDARGFQDVADVVTVCLWTGARQGDVCAAGLSELSGLTWRYIPSKTKKNAQEALPGLLQPVKARVHRRAQAARADTVRTLNDPPFAWDVKNQRQHTADTIGARFREARHLAVYSDALPDSFLGKRLQDTRDTCVTRLFDADVPMHKIPPWTGHSGRDRDDILRDHYLTLREHGALETAAKLERYASAMGFDWMPG